MWIAYFKSQIDTLCLAFWLEDTFRFSSIFGAFCRPAEQSVLFLKIKRWKKMELEKSGLQERTEDGRRKGIWEPGKTSFRPAGRLPQLPRWFHLSLLSPLFYLTSTEREVSKKWQAIDENKPKVLQGLSAHPSVCLSVCPHVRTLRLYCMEAVT